MAMKIIDLRNPIFGKARKLASGLVADRMRLTLLLTSIGKKLSQIEDKKRIGQDIKEKIVLFSRLLKASASRQYKALPWRSALSIAAALIYFINPADIVPDIVPISGFLDDFTVLVWTYNSLHLEIEAFKQWEKSNLNRS